MDKRKHRERGKKNERERGGRGGGTINGNIQIAR